MIIRSVNIKGFGKLSDEKIEFEDGLNIVYGPNESGKSTIRGFIINMLFGMKRSRGRSSKTDDFIRFEPADGSGIYSGSIEIEDEGKSYTLMRDFYAGARKNLLFSNDGEDVTVDLSFGNPFFPETGRSEYTNISALSQNEAADNKLLAQSLARAGINEGSDAEEAELIRRSIEKLAREKKEADTIYKKALQSRDERLEKIAALIEYEQEEKGFSDYIFEEPEIRESNHTAKPWVVIPFIIAAVLLVAGAFLTENLRIILLILAAGLGVAGIFAAKLAISRRISPASEEFQIRKKISGEENAAAEDRLRKLKRLYNEAAEDENVIGAQKEVQSLSIAMDTMQKIALEHKRIFCRRLNEKAQSILREILGEPDIRLIIDEEMIYMLLRDKVPVRDWQCSTGTSDLIDQVLRLAAAQLSLSGDDMPLILDDAFANLDDIRCKNILKMLAASPRQVILFTCHKREIELLEELNLPYERVRWSGNC